MLEGADLTVSARRVIWGKGLNAGQTCIASDHLIVQPGLKTELLKAMASARTEMYGADPRAAEKLA